MEKNVLIVDDDTLALKYLRQIVEGVVDTDGQKVYTVHTAHNSMEALNILKNNPSCFGVVITDMYMEYEAAGLAIANHLSEHNIDTKLIIASAFPKQAPQIGRIDNQQFFFIQKNEDDFEDILVNLLKYLFFAQQHGIINNQS